MSAPLLLSVFPTFAVGGAQMRFTTIANHLGPSWRHAIVAMDGVVAARALLDPALDVTFPEVGARKGDLVGNVRRFRGVLRSMRPAALLTHNFGSIEWSIANRLRLVHQVHVEDGFGPEERSRQIGRRVWLRRMFLRGRTVVLPSRTLMRIAREVWRLPARGLHYVPNGIDLTRFTRSDAASADVVVGTVSALRPEKNIGRLIRAFGLASAGSSARLMLIGDGAERAGLERLVADSGLGGRVVFAGHVAQPAAAIRGLDVFAMSSDTEQMPISLLEAMASGLPVAATDVGDIRAMLSAGHDGLVTALDDVALAGALRRLIGDAELRRRLGAENRAKAEREFGQEAMFRRWSALLQAQEVEG